VVDGAAVASVTDPEIVVKVCGTNPSSGENAEITVDRLDEAAVMRN
jgi:hypothetical protein